MQTDKVYEEVADLFNIKNLSDKCDEISKIVTIDRCRDFAPHLVNFYDGLIQTLAIFDISNHARIKHFLGQCCHETGNFAFVQELWGPTDAQRRYEPPSSLATRLGNTHKGDGKLFMGRGFLQCTGRNNYRSISEDLNQDFIMQPELLSSHEYAPLSAGWYWHKHHLNDTADSRLSFEDTVHRITRIINGGTNGLSDRLQKTHKASIIFT